MKPVKKTHTRIMPLVLAAVFLIAISCNIVGNFALPAGDGEQFIQTTLEQQDVTPEQGLMARNTSTPDQSRLLPPLRTDRREYIVQPSDTLGKIADKHMVNLDILIKENDIQNPDALEVGQTISIPAPDPGPSGPAFKIVPDSELVYGPATILFDTEATTHQYNAGFLANYREELEGKTYSGVEILMKVSRNYSVNPRLLIVMLEYLSGWMTSPDPPDDIKQFPMRYYDPQRGGLYRQLSWAANHLNRGYYLWRVNALPGFNLLDGTIIPADPTINAGTAAIQYFFSRIMSYDEWNRAIQSEGFIETYTEMMGYPFDFAYEPLIPEGLEQPELQLPFEEGKSWSFTGGPHGGWGDGSAWAAIDFAPPKEILGCITNDEWVVAMADGLVTRSEDGVVIQDLDGDGWEQTGWSLFYLHIETRDRVEVGTYLEAGEKIGHPSCEGGYSTGTHVHIARRYNGEWIAADTGIPFVMDGWISIGNGIEYNGSLLRDGISVEAYDGKRPENQIQR